MVSEYTTVTVNGYQGEVHVRDGRIGSLPNAPVGDGFLPDASQLRLYAEFILELAETSELVIEMVQEIKREGEHDEN